MKIKTKEICLYGLLGALMFAFKFAMSSLPNIEPVSLLLISFAVTFGVKAIYPLLVYIILEMLIYGFGFWSIGYLYIWPVLVIAALLINKVVNSSFIWAVVSGLFGLIFGALYIPLYLISGGFTFAITWWTSGLPYDFIHCVSNFILCLILFKPITNTLSKFKEWY